MALNKLGQLEVEFVQVRTRATEPTHGVRFEQLTELLAGKSDSAHTHANDHVALTLATGLLSMTLSLSGQQLGAEVRRGTNSGLLIAADGLKLDFGSGANQVARGNHVHVNDHAAATADASQDNSITVTVTPLQAIKAALRVKANGGLTVDADGVFVSFGSLATQAAPGNHGHADATTTVAGFMSAADKVKLDGMTGGAGASYTFANTYSTALTNTDGTVTCDIRAHTGISVTAAGVAVDFTAVAAFGHTHSDATTIAAGFMSAADKEKLDALSTGDFHDALTIGAGNKSLALSLSGQILTGEVKLAAASGLLIPADGLKVEFGTGVNQVARGNHTHSNDHAAVTLDTQTNSLTLVLTGQAIKGDVRLKANGGILVDANGLYLSLGTGATQAAAGNHTHSAATDVADGFMSAADKAKLDGLTGTYESPLTFSNTTSVEFSRDVNTVTAAAKVTTGLQLLAGGIGVDFSLVATASHNHGSASSGAAGFMSAADKVKLDGFSVTAFDTRYVRLDTGTPTDVQWIKSVVRAGGLQVDSVSGVLKADGSGIVSGQARLSDMNESTSSWRFKADGNFQLWNATAEKWQTVFLTGATQEESTMAYGPMED
jgi:hypothetical protein